MSNLSKADEHGKARLEHKEKALAAMAKESSVEGRLRAFLQTQQNMFDSRIDAFPISDELKSELKNENSIYKSETEYIISAVVNGVK